MKRYWMRSIQEITKRETIHQRSSIANSCFCFSSPRSLYFSATPVRNSHFTEKSQRPMLPVVQSPAKEAGKVCVGCGARLSFISAKPCDICGNAFCKNCCNEKLLHTSREE